MTSSEHGIILNSLADAAASMERGNVVLRVEPERDRILASAGKGLPGEVAIIWDEQRALVQCLYPFPFQIPAERTAAVADAIARINHALVLPGLGMDHASRLAYCRIVSPRREDGSLTVRELQRVVGATLSTARDMLQALEEVATAKLEPAAVLDRAAALRSTDTSASGS
jgi:hypothetical protein